MLTRREYSNLWDRFGNLDRNLQMPSYGDYVARENMLEDYLDIFRGRNTRNEREADTVPYPHPYFSDSGEPLVRSTPKIKYLLIGEAAPQQNPPKIVNLEDCKMGGRDEANTYFYNITYLKNSNYLSSAKINFQCPPFKPCIENKIRTLICLTTKGVLLLDLFPYALQYSPKLRHAMNASGITSYYWNDPANPVNLESRMEKLSNMMDMDWDLCMVAPGVISSFIIEPANGLKAIQAPISGKHPAVFRDLHSYPNRFQGLDWKKLAVAQQSPGAKLIQIAFT